MKKALLLIVVLIVILMVVFSAQASPKAPDYLTFQWFVDHILMKWNGPTYADHYVGNVCIQKIIPFNNITSCMWVHGTLYPTHEIWFYFAYKFTSGTYRLKSGNVTAYDSFGGIISTESFVGGGDWTFFGRYLPFLRKSNSPYP